MALQTFPFNNTDGVTITSGNSGAATVTISASCTAQYKAGAAFQGATGAEFTVASTGFSNATFNLTSSATTGAFSLRFKVPSAAPAATQQLLQVNDTSGARILQVQYTTTGLVKVNDKSNVTTTILTAAQATAGTSFRLELVITSLSATTGAYTARAYSTGSTQVGSTASSSTANTGTTNINGATIGVLVSGAVYTIDVDSLQMNGGSTSEIGEYSPNSTPPTINSVSPDQTISTAGSTVNVTASATAANGDSIASYAWSWVDAISSTGTTISNPTLTGATTANASFVMPSTKGRYRLQVTATDTSGNVSAPSTVRVYYPDTVFAPIDVISQTGATGVVGNLTDASDATIVDLGAVGSGNQVLYRLSPVVSSPTSFQLDIRSLVSAVGGTQHVELLDSDGTTVRKDWGALAPGTSFADQLLSLTNGEIATIVNWNALVLRLTQV